VHIDAGCGSDVLAVANCAHGAAELRCREIHGCGDHHGEQHRHDRERAPVRAHGVTQHVRRGDAQAVGSVGDLVPRVEDPLRCFGEGKGREGEIDGAQPGRRKADQHPDGAGEQSGKRHADDERESEPDLKERSGIDADAEERDMRKGELTGPAEQQVKPSASTADIIRMLPR